jgi:hypothetical protein
MLTNSTYSEFLDVISFMRAKCPTLSGKVIKKNINAITVHYLQSSGI